MMGYGLEVLRIERARENGFNAEEEAKKKKGLSMQNRGRVHHLSLFLSLCPNLILYFIASLFLCFFPRSSLPLSLSLSLSFIASISISVYTLILTGYCFCYL